MSACEVAHILLFLQARFSLALGARSMGVGPCWGVPTLETCIISFFNWMRSQESGIAFKRDLKFLRVGKQAKCQAPVKNLPQPACLAWAFSWSPWFRTAAVQQAWVPRPQLLQTMGKMTCVRLDLLDETLGWALLPLFHSTLIRGFCVPIQKPAALMPLRSTCRGRPPGDGFIVSSKRWLPCVTCGRNGCNRPTTAVHTPTSARSMLSYWHHSDTGDFILFEHIRGCLGLRGLGLPAVITIVFVVGLAK